MIFLTKEENMKSKLQISYIKSDLYRYSGKYNLFDFFKTIVLNRGFRLLFYFRMINSVPLNMLKKKT